MGWAGLVTYTVIRLVSNVLAKGKRYIVSGPAVEVENTETPVSRGNGVGHTEAGAATGIEEDGSAQQGKTEAYAIGGDELFGFPHFDVVQSPPDHHYLDNKEVRNSLTTNTSLSLTSIKMSFLNQNNDP